MYKKNIFNAVMHIEILINDDRHLHYWLDKETENKCPLLLAKAMSSHVYVFACVRYLLPMIACARVAIEQFCARVLFFNICVL